MVYYSVPVVCALPAEYCDSAVGWFHDILRSAACHAGSFLRVGILGILPIYETDKNKLLFIPYYFLFMNVNVLKGIRYLKKKKGSGAWEKAKRAEK